MSSSQLPSSHAHQNNEQSQRDTLVFDGYYDGNHGSDVRTNAHTVVDGKYVNETRNDHFSQPPQHYHFQPTASAVSYLNTRSSYGHNHMLAERNVVPLTSPQTFPTFSPASGHNSHVAYNSSANYLPDCSVTAPSSSSSYTLTSEQQPFASMSQPNLYPPFPIVDPCHMGFNPSSQVPQVIGNNAYCHIDDNDIRHVRRTSCDPYVFLDANKETMSPTVMAMSRLPEQVPQNARTDEIVTNNYSNIATSSVGVVSSSIAAASSCPPTTGNNVKKYLDPKNALKEATLADIRPLFHLTLAEAATSLGICPSLLKKICRKLSIQKWPYRQLLCYINKKKSLEHLLSNYCDPLAVGVKDMYRDQIEVLKIQIEKIKDDAVSSALVSNNGNVERSESSCGFTAHDDNINVTAASKMQNDDDAGLVNTASCEDQHHESHASDYSTEIDSISLTKGQEEKKDIGKISRKTDTALSPDDGGNFVTRKRTWHSSTSFPSNGTGWVANCSSCGRVGKYRHPSLGRLFQHSLVSGKYCGYYRENPRREEEYFDELHNNNKNATSSSY